MLSRVAEVLEVLARVHEGLEELPKTSLHVEVLATVLEVLEVLPQTSLQVEVLARVPVMLRPRLTHPPGQGKLCNVQTKVFPGPRYLFNVQTEVFQGPR